MDNFSTWTTCSETIEGALANALDAKTTWLEAALEEAPTSVFMNDCLTPYVTPFMLFLEGCAYAPV